LCVKDDLECDLGLLSSWRLFELKLPAALFLHTYINKIKNLKKENVVYINYFN
jgi:hypothetical protein